MLSVVFKQFIGLFLGGQTYIELIAGWATCSRCLRPGFPAQSDTPTDWAGDGRYHRDHCHDVLRLDVLRLDVLRLDGGVVDGHNEPGRYRP
jgi:hypothetical protein